MNVSEKIKFLKGSLNMDLLEEALDITVVKTMGEEDICSCPLPSHDGVDRNPSFSVNRDKLVYYCFACNIGGNIIDLVARIKDVDYDSAYQFCKTYNESSFKTSDSAAFKQKIESIFSENSEPAKTPMPVYSKSILADWLGSYSNYFDERGINERSQDKFFLGFDANHERGNYSGPAAIIPHFFEGNLVGYQERWIDENRPSSIPKYTNSKNFPKKETLFGYDNVVNGNKKEPVVVVESALTAIYLDQIGFSSVATFGASISDEQISLMKSFPWGAIIAFDNDSAGFQATELVVSRLRKTIPIHIVEIVGEQKSDLNDFSERDVVQFIENAKPWFMKGI